MFLFFCRLFGIIWLNTHLFPCMVPSHGERLTPIKEVESMSEPKRDELQMLSQLLPAVAASLRSPMDSLQLAAQGLIGKTGTNTPEAAILRQSCFRMLRLLNNMSMAPLLDDDLPFYLTDADLVAFVEKFHYRCAALAELSGIKLQMQCSETFLPTAIHREYLERAVWNLISNAFKFTPEGGTVTLSLEKTDTMALLSVADTGCGIPSAMMETVFDRCLHTDRNDPTPHGLGLGLLIARRVAEGHSGRLLLESREGKGTTVTLALPLQRGCQESVRQPVFDYAGGFNPALLELSDALPYCVFTDDDAL